MNAKRTEDCQRMEKLELLNDFTNRSFRDEADGDYIAARMAYRLRLYNQFLWCSLQSIEKYFKAILLYNEVDTRPFKNHNLSLLLDKVLHITPPIPFVFPKPLPKYMAYLTTYGNNRYFSKPIHLEGFELLELDRAVWYIRRYCICLIAPDGWYYPWTRESFLQAIHNPFYEENKYRFDLVSGFLLEVLKRNPADLARQTLVWKNLYFGARKKKSIVHKPMLQIAIPAHILDPQCYDIVKNLVHFSKEEKAQFQQDE